ALALVQRLQDPALLAEAHYTLGVALYNLGEITLAHAHFEQGITRTDAQPLRSWPGIMCRTYVALALAYLGYPEPFLFVLGPADGWPGLSAPPRGPRGPRAVRGSPGPRV